MRFAHVDGQEIGVVFIVIVNLHDVADLATKGRSSKATENEYERTTGCALADVETGLAIESEEPGVRSIVAHFQSSAVHVRERIPHHIDGVLRAARQIGEGPDGQDHEHQHNAKCPFQEPLHAALLQQIDLGPLQKDKPHA